MNAVVEMDYIWCELGTGAERFLVNVHRFALGAGQAMALVGPSGCGKSTVLDLIGGMLRPANGAGDRGAFRFRPADRDIDLLEVWRHNRRDELTELRGRYLGYVLQTGGLLSYLSARQNIMAPLRLAGLHGGRGHFDHLVESLGLGGILDLRPGQLSIGQRQRVTIARALIHKPALILADEPTASLDPSAKQAAFRLLLDAASEQGAAVLVATHDRALSDSLALPHVIHEFITTKDRLSYSRFHTEGGFDA